jgi:hypothetical protein
LYLLDPYSSTSDSQAPLAEEGSREREPKGKGAAEKSGEELGRALTKSFRYNLVNGTIDYSAYFHVGATFEMRTGLYGIRLLIDNMIMHDKVHI